MTTIDLNHESICINPTDDLTLYDKNHIMSRIEKFLFAICSLDSSDLPIPLSRIEELYNCLVTGDTPPTFEPLSRAEKFLMACLGAYDINKLPEPLSRSEVLLKKIATGDSNLEDVDNLKSKYEFLLTYIIQNGGINVDISHMKYVLTEKETTLYNTKERSVRSAILKGNTLVNLGGTYNRTDTPTWFTVFATQQEVEQGNVYYAIINNTGDGLMRLRYKTSDVVIKTVNPMSCEKFIFTATESDYLRIKNSDTISNCDGTFLLLKYQEGMENWDIPYFEGMQSVKMPVLTTYGKNLFDVSRHGSLTPQPTGDIQLNSAEWGKYDVKYILKPNTQYTLTILGDGTKCWIAIIVDGSSQSSNVETSYTKTFSTNSNGEVTIGIYANSDKYVGYSRKSISIEEGTVSTPYEPYKSNILSCNEEIILRSNGNIYDELDLLTGCLTQRIDENNEVLAQEVVKTVDLSIVDQDGNDTKLSSFNDITYVTLSSEGLIPEAELEVVTKNEEVLNTLSLEMDDISTAQTTLEETSNTQSENVDSTMIATTEIYEGLL